VFTARSYKLRHVPLRLATGAYILNAGLGKRSLTEDAAAGLQAGAARVVPAVKDWPPATFGKTLSKTEMTVGGLLLAPFVPSGLAGAALAGFSGGLLTMYWRNPELHEPGSPRPTQKGSAIAKDVWMFGIGTSLLIDACLMRRRRRRACR
jgi:hypothetical protein